MRAAGMQLHPLPLLSLTTALEPGRSCGLYRHFSAFRAGPVCARLRSESACGCCARARRLLVRGGAGFPATPAGLALRLPAGRRSRLQPAADARKWVPRAPGTRRLARMHAPRVPRAEPLAARLATRGARCTRRSALTSALRLAAGRGWEATALHPPPRAERGASRRRAGRRRARCCGGGGGRERQEGAAAADVRRCAALGPGSCATPRGAHLLTPFWLRLTDRADALPPRVVARRVLRRRRV